MKNKLFIFGMLAAFMSTLAGCEVIGGIFKAGVWSGVLLVVLGIGLIIFLISRVFGKKE